MLKFVVRSHPGCVRQKNEDRFYVPPESGLPVFAVADGMGGHVAGEVASSMAIDTLEKNFSALTENFSHYDMNQIKKYLENTIHEANENIINMQLRKPELKGMGTTLTAAVFLNNNLLTGHVGDSQAHLFNKSGHVQITEDHSVVMELLKNGEIKPHEVYNHPQRNFLTRALGTASSLKLILISLLSARGLYTAVCG